MYQVRLRVYNDLRLHHYMRTYQDYKHTHQELTDGDVAEWRNLERCQFHHSSLVSKTPPRLSSLHPSSAKCPQGAWEEVEGVADALVEKPLDAGYPSLQYNKKIRRFVIDCKLIHGFDYEVYVL